MGCLHNQGVVWEGQNWKKDRFLNMNEYHTHRALHRSLGWRRAASKANTANTCCPQEWCQKEVPAMAASTE